MIVPTKTYLKVWAALMVLLILTIGLAQLNLGPFNLAVALLIAFAKAILIALIFMHIKGSHPILHIVAGVGLFWFAIMLALTMNDYLTRHEIPARGTQIGIVKRESP